MNNETLSSFKNDLQEYINTPSLDPDNKILKLLKKIAESEGNDPK